MAVRVGPRPPSHAWLGSCFRLGGPADRGTGGSGGTYKRANTQWRHIRKTFLKNLSLEDALLSNCTGLPNASSTSL